MIAFKIRLNGNDQEPRFASKLEAEMLANVFSDDYPSAKVEIVEIWQSTIGTGSNAKTVETEKQQATQ